MKYIITEEQNLRMIHKMEKLINLHFEGHPGICEIKITPIDPEDESDDLFDVWVHINEEYILSLGEILQSTGKIKYEVRKFIIDWFGTDKFYVSTMVREC